MKLFDKINISTQGRFWIIGFVFAIAVVFFIISMLRMIMGTEGERWREIGSKINRPVPEPLYPRRGSIYAADGRPIAIMAPFYRMYIDFRATPIALVHNDSLRMPKDSLRIAERRRLRDSLSGELDKLADVLEQTFAERGIVVNKKAMRESWRKGFLKKSRYTLVARHDLSYLQYKQLLDMDPLGRQPNKKGNRVQRSLLSKLITLEERSVRINPFGSLALRTIGSLYASKKDGLSQGKQGLEMYYDSLLRGERGEAVKEYAAQQYNRRVITPAVDGANIYTTLDMNKQNQLERIMRSQLGALSAGSGTAVLMEVATGKVLAMTNLQRNSQGDYNETMNHAVSDLSEPGSTFKVASMLVALNDGVVSPTDTIDVGNGLWKVGGRIVRDHNAHRGGYGRISVSQAIEYSSNVGVAKIVQGHYGSRPDEFVDKVRAMGFGHDLKIEIPGAAQARIRKRSDNPNRWYNTTLAWMSFGYETQIPPMYTVAFFNAIANGGRFMRPYMVEEVRSAKHEILERHEPTVLIEQIARPESIKAMQEMLRRVVTEGTGKTLRSDIVAISGKSGTAQIAKGGSYHGPDGTSHQVSFCGYFPSEAPRYTLMVVIREPSQAFAAGGGSMAGPVVRELAEAIISMETPLSLDSIPAPAPSALAARIASGRKSELQPTLQGLGLKYTPTSEVPADAFVRIDAQGREQRLPAYRKGVIPSVVGMSATDAHFLLLEHGYRARLSGHGKVLTQAPAAGTVAPRGATITLGLEQ